MLAIEVDRPVGQRLFQVLTPPHFSLHSLSILAMGRFEVPAVGAFMLRGSQGGVGFGQQVPETAVTAVINTPDTANEI